MTKKNGNSLVQENHLTSRSSLMLITAIILAGLGTFLCIVQQSVGLLIFVALLLLAVFVSLRNAEDGFFLALAIGVFSGFVRRFSTYFFGYEPALDYLNVLPALIIALTLYSVSRSRVYKPKVPTWFRIVFAAILIAGFNPLGSGFAANLATSALIASFVGSYFLVQALPVNLDRFLNLLLILSLINSLYALAQNFYGFSPWDILWITEKGYASLYIGDGIVRPFGMSSSGAETSSLAGIGTTISVFLILSKKDMKRNAFILLVSLTALTVIGTRTFFILTFIGITASLASKSKGKFKSRFLLSLTFFAAVAIAVARILPPDLNSGLSRILGFIGGTEDYSTSTAPIHALNVFRGFQTGLSTLVGTGSGQLSVLANSQTASSEFDASNLVLMSGVIGLCALVAIYAGYFKQLLYVLKENSFALPAALGTIATFGQWFNPGCYGVTPMIWACLGFLFLARTGEKT